MASNHSAVSDLPTQHGTSVSKMAYTVVVMTLGPVIILMNLTVVISSGLILRSGAEPRATYLFLGNVALADMVTGWAVMLGLQFPHLNRSLLMCTSELGAIVASTLTSIWSVALIAADRFVYIQYGLYYHRWVTARRARLSIVAAWALAHLVGFVPIITWPEPRDNSNQCWFIVLTPPFAVLAATALSLLPIVGVAVLYTKILFTALAAHGRNRLKKFDSARTARIKQRMRKRKSQIEEYNEEDVQTTNETRNKDKIKTVDLQQTGSNQKCKKNKQLQKQTAIRRWKSIMVVFLTTFSIVLTWMPYMVVAMFYILYNCKADTLGLCTNLRLAISSPLAGLGFMNSVLNPIIYAWWHKGFRKYWFKLCCRERLKEKQNKLLGDTKIKADIGRDKEIANIENLISHM